MLNLDNVRNHTEVGTGYTKDAMLNLCADEIERLRAENEALKRDAEWISVDDRLPPMEESVICYCRIHGRFLGYRKQILGTRSEFTWANWEGESGLLPPTHWRPLQLPPDRAMKG